MFIFIWHKSLEDARFLANGVVICQATLTNWDKWVSIEANMLHMNSWACGLKELSVKQLTLDHGICLWMPVGNIDKFRSPWCWSCQQVVKMPSHSIHDTVMWDVNCCGGIWNIVKGYEIILRVILLETVDIYLKKVYTQSQNGCGMSTEKHSKFTSNATLGNTSTRWYFDSLIYHLAPPSQSASYFAGLVGMLGSCWHRPHLF